MNQHDSHADSHEHEHEHAGFGTYMAVFGGLVVLTIISCWIGNSGIKDNSPGAAWAGMMAVSCGKALLVILFFMHLKWEANWKYVLTIPAMMMSVFLVCMLIPDIGMRRNHYSRERLVHAAKVVPADASAQHGEHDAHDDGHGDDHHSGDH